MGCRALHLQIAGLDTSPADGNWRKYHLRYFLKTVILGATFTRWNPCWKYQPEVLKAEGTTEDRDGERDGKEGCDFQRRLKELCTQKPSLKTQEWTFIWISKTTPMFPRSVTPTYIGENSHASRASPLWVRASVFNKWALTLANSVHL